MSTCRNCENYDISNQECDIFNRPQSPYMSADDCNYYRSRSTNTYDFGDDCDESDNNPLSNFFKNLF